MSLTEPAGERSLVQAVLQLWALLLGIALLLAGNGLQGTLLGVVAEDSGFSSALTGLVMTAYFAGFFAGSASAERLIGRVGHVRTFAALASLGSIAILVHGLIIDPWVWAGMRFLTGFSFAGLYVVAESWLNRESSNTYRGALLAIYMIITHGSLAIGQGLLNTAPTSSLTLYALSSIIISGALVPILLSSAPQPHFTLEIERLTLRKLFKISPLGLTGSFCAGVANGIILGMGAVYARRLGFEVGGVSLFMAATLVGGAALQWPVGRLSDAWDRRYVIAGVAAGAAVIAALMPMAADQGLVALTCAGFFAGGLTMTLYPLSMAHTHDWLEVDQMTPASSALVMVYGGGAMLGPLGTGLLMGAFGTSGFAYYLSGLCLALSAYAVYRITRRQAPDSTEDYLLAPAAISAGEYWAETAVEEAGESEDDPAEPQAT